MLPVEFCERMKNYLGEEEFDSFINSFGDNSGRFHALRFNRLKVTSGIDEKIIAQFGLKEKVSWENTGFYYDSDMAPGKSPYHDAGVYYIQEPSAMAPVHYLEPKPGEKILDLCAAPGGKSTQIATSMNGEGLLVSNEINRDRAKILSLNVERLGVKNCMVLNETPEHLSEVFEGFFDKILVDAPCSGEGMFRKNEIATSEWSPENVIACANRQENILDFASKMLLPGGTLVYSTCTFAADENEESIFKFLLTHRDFHVEKVPLFEGMANAMPELIRTGEILKAYSESLSDAELTEDFMEVTKKEVSKAIRLWPHRIKGEGHFLCVIKRDGELISNEKNCYIPGGKNTPAKKEQIKIFEEFAKETLLTDGFDVSNIFMFGDQMYLAPTRMPSIKGLKVMRPGLHLGTIKKDRFEPSHALALALNKEEVKESYDFSENSDEIRQYLNGQTIRIGDKNKRGWGIVTVDGYSLGWVKAAAGMLKNHYPKGLRINY